MEQEAAESVTEVLLRFPWRRLSQLLDEGIARVEEFEHVLCVIGRYHVVAGLSLPVVHWNDACEQLQHCGLAGAVRSDQRNPVAA